MDFLGVLGSETGSFLSPLLFAIVLDALGRMLDKAVDDGCISVFSVGDTVGILLRYLISTLPMIP